MGGGEGAKERRRLKRLSGQVQEEERTNSTRKVRRPVVAVKGKSSFKVKTRDGGDDKPNLASKKVKKPKHLKRKLEQLSADDERTREIVLKEIEEFEQTKAKLGQSSNKKRPKRVEEEKNENAMFVPLKPVIPAATRVFAHKLEVKENSKNTVVDKDMVDGEAPHGNNKEERKIPSDSKNEPSSMDVSGSEDEDDEEDDDLKNVHRRERGRRRRGRKDTAKQIIETQIDTVPKPNVETSDAGVTSTSEEEKSKRYCIGRKPVTDFLMGQKYPAKVVYVKDFGVFFDIGCHSDAFCHVSRLRDDYVENPHELFKEGDEVEARVVEIDRKHKRITVSLQSDERVADERASMEAREHRKKARNESRRKNKKREESRETSEPNVDKKAKEESPDKKKSLEKTSISEPIVSKIPIPLSKKPLNISSPTSITPAEEKRARKLARRAARREQTTERES